MKAKNVKSADGTAIAFQAVGSGAPLILVGGAFNDRSTRAAGTPLAELLASRFTVFSYDRRGRGESGATGPGSIEREVEDLAALIDEAGAPAFVYGLSSGGLLALHAAVAELPIAKLALYEPPLIMDASRASALSELSHQLDEATSGGRREEAVELFMTRVMQMPPPAVAQARQSPMWSHLESLAHTLGQDVRLTARAPALMEQVSSVRCPTLAMHGDRCPPWMQDAVRALASAVPAGRQLVLEGQTHDVNLETLARALEEFFDA